jgi:hypothetical protein
LDPIPGICRLIPHIEANQRPTKWAICDTNSKIVISILSRATMSEKIILAQILITAMRGSQMIIIMILAHPNLSAQATLVLLSVGIQMLHASIPIAEKSNTIAVPNHDAKN